MGNNDANKKDMIEATTERTFIIIAQLVGAGKREISHVSCDLTVAPSMPNI